MTSARVLLALGGAAVVAACVPNTEPPPPPPQRRPIQPIRPAPPAPPPAPADWRDMALTPGGWQYRAEGNISQAMFGPAGGQAAFVVRCDRAARQVTLIRGGVPSGTAMTVRTTFGARNFAVTPNAVAPAGVMAAVAASDRTLDGIAFSRGRFTVEMAGQPMLVIPAWPEPARAVEDCRG